MTNKGLFTFLTLVLSTLAVPYAHGQVTSQRFVILDSNKRAIDIDHFIIKGDNKNHAFKMDTASVEYRSLSGIDPSWIKEVEVLKDKPLHGGTNTVVVITLRKVRSKDCQKK